MTVECCAKNEQGPDPFFGNIWRCRSREPIVTWEGEAGHFGYFPEQHLEKIDESEPNQGVVEKKELTA